MKRAAALLVIAIFLVVSIYAAAGAVEKMQENNSINLENIENALAESVPFRSELIALMTKIRFISSSAATAACCETWKSRKRHFRDALAPASRTSPGALKPMCI